MKLLYILPIIIPPMINYYHSIIVKLVNYTIHNIFYTNIVIYYVNYIFGKIRFLRDSMNHIKDY